jgi:hypothetical protein
MEGRAFISLATVTRVSVKSWYFSLIPRLEALGDKFRVEYECRRFLALAYLSSGIINRGLFRDTVVRLDIDGLTCSKFGDEV